MIHRICCVRSFSIIGPFALHLVFDDGVERDIDFLPVLAGEVFGPLRNPAEFNQVRLDAEVHTLVWPNGADFDPAVLHDRPEHLESMVARAREWDRAEA